MIAKSEKTLIFAARQQQFCKNRVPDACGKGDSDELDKPNKSLYIIQQQ